MAKQDSVQLMTKGSVAKQIIGYAIPIFIGYLFQQLYNTVDALIVGNFLGQDALAAVTSVGSLIFLFVGFFNGFATGASVIIANAIGAQDEDRTKKSGIYNCYIRDYLRTYYDGEWICINRSNVDMDGFA